MLEHLVQQKVLVPYSNVKQKEREEQFSDTVVEDYKIPCRYNAFVSSSSNALLIPELRSPTSVLSD